MIGRGGDTDTNGAIVGGLIGAAVGYNKLPSKFKDKVMSWEPSKKKPVLKLII
jgi:ADP-ribosylglycohydrolase